MRRIAGLQQRELEERAAEVIGQPVSRDWVSRRERGETPISPEDCVILAAGLGLDLDIVRAELLNVHHVEVRFDHGPTVVPVDRDWFRLESDMLAPVLRRGDMMLFHQHRDPIEVPTGTIAMIAYPTSSGERRFVGFFAADGPQALRLSHNDVLRPPVMLDRSNVAGIHPIASLRREFTG